MSCPRAFRASSSQSLCVFCANKLGVEASPARRPLHVQRRYLQSSRPLPAEGPAAAVAPVPEKDQDQQSSGSSGGWGRRPVAASLSPEEEALRNRIIQQKKAQTHHDHRHPTRPTRFGSASAGEGQFSFKPHQAAEGGQRIWSMKATNHGHVAPVPHTEKNSNAHHAESAKLDPSVNTNHVADFKKPPHRQRNNRAEATKGIGHLGKNFRTANRGSKPVSDTTSERGKNEFDPSVASSWRHVNRRRDQENNGSPEGPDPAPHKLERFESQRRVREDTARNGGFVGFNGPRKGRSAADSEASAASSTTSLPSKEEPSIVKEEDRPQFSYVPQALSQSDGPTVEESTEKSTEKSTKDQEEVYQEEETRPARERRRREKFASEDEEASSVSKNGKEAKGRGRDKSRRREQFATEYEDEDTQEAQRADRKRQRKKEKAAQRAAQKAAASTIPIMLPEYISVGNLASALRVRVDDFVAKMEELGFEETSHDHVLNSETAGLIAMEYNYEPIVDKSESEDLRPRPAPEDKSLLPVRPPVVTIMGHVDHGKTTLLDWLRKSSVAASEHGGITQHIGAFSVHMPSGKLITFLDTPGHAAFLDMRQRGANVTDIVILVVAADDSVKPQTIEAINHAKAAKVPIIVAVNKIDKEEANVERVKHDLARHGVDVEDFGGDTQVVCVSGKTGQGMEELEEAAITLSEILDMRGDTTGPVEGWVLEATTKKAGRVATVLVRRGTLRAGAAIVAGSTWARVRSLRNEAGQEVEQAGPGTPVEVDGWKEQPNAGDEVLQAEGEQKAKRVVDFRVERAERFKLAEDMDAINENRRAEQEKRDRDRDRIRQQLMTETDGAIESTEGDTATAAGPGIKEVFFIVKGDVSGSVEAVVNSVSALGNSEVRAHVLRSGVGPVGEFDIDHAAVAHGYIISFNMPVEPNISRLAEAEGVEILDENIIYRLVDGVRAKLSERLPPLVTSRVVGEAEVAQIFDIGVGGRRRRPFAGCKVRNGVVARNAKVRVLRNAKDVVYDGTLQSLKQVKKDVAEMRKGGECGLGFEGWDAFAVGDLIQAYEEKVEKRVL
ncbi:MAG: hypothetical protein M1819_006102 [Sarea resinae]|nr:MAG: hypothetical protein M1819_006102 [Sarea resinae]